MRVAILAGGLGTRLREETEFRPKPMVEVGGRPILWHIMKVFAAHGHQDFIICLGYKGDVIRDYFLNYETRNCDFSIMLGSREVEINACHAEHGWRVTLAETGDMTMTGGRVRRIARYLGGHSFMVTYGDGVADIDLSRLLALHRARGKLGTVSAVRPLSRFGELGISDGMVSVFREKPQIHDGWINGGFFIFEPQVLDMIASDDEPLEAGLLARLARDRQLAVYQHEGFWQCMDTYREAQMLNEMWNTGRAPWVVWR